MEGNQRDRKEREEKGREEKTGMKTSSLILKVEVVAVVLLFSVLD